MNSKGLRTKKPRFTDTANLSVYCAARLAALNHRNLSYSFKLASISDLNSG